MASGSGSDRDWFCRQEVADGLYLIRERFFESGNRANIWLLQGSHRDLVVDAGLGLRSLPAYLRESGLSAGSKPLLAVASHVHFDHSGGLQHFERVAVHRAEAGALSRGDNFEAVTWLSDGELSRRPEPGWRAAGYRVRAVQPAQILEHGDIISLGDRQLAVLHMPGHSRGSICLHDRQHGLLFSGDVAYDGALIDWLPYSSISDYSRSCSELMGLVDSGLVRTVLPGHFNPFGAEKLRSLAAQYIANAGLCHKVSTGAVRGIANLVLRGKNLVRSVVDQ